MYDVIANPIPRYIRNTYTLNRVKNYQMTLINEKPAILFSALRKKRKCFCFARHKLMDRMQMPYDICKDMTDDLAQSIRGLQDRYIRVHTILKWYHGNGESRLKWNIMTSKFKIMSKEKFNCQSIEFIDNSQLKYLKPYIMVKSCSEYSLFLSAVWYWLFSALGLTLFYRLYFNSKTGFYQNTIQKIIYC